MRPKRTSVPFTDAAEQMLGKLAAALHTTKSGALAFWLEQTEPQMQARLDSFGKRLSPVNPSGYKADQVLNEEI